MDTRIAYNISADIFEAAARSDRPRKYLGMSSVGTPCDREIWFRFRQFTPISIDPRIIFLFRFGDKVEELVCTYLREAGYKLEGAFPEPQLAYSVLGGLHHGRSDGIIHLPEWRALLECKSASKKKFQAFTLGGVRAVYEKYYWQAQLYMGCAGLDRALFVIVNKDDSNIHTEVMPANRADFDAMIARVRRITTSTTWPQIMDLPDCQYCDFRLHCKTTEGRQASHSCMTCNHLRVIPNEPAEFHCGHALHALQIHHPDMVCPEYSWLADCPY